MTEAAAPATETKTEEKKARAPLTLSSVFNWLSDRPRHQYTLGNLFFKDGHRFGPTGIWFPAMDRLGRGTERLATAAGLVGAGVVLATGGTAALGAAFLLAFTGKLGGSFVGRMLTDMNGDIREYLETRKAAPAAPKP